MYLRDQVARRGDMPWYTMMKNVTTNAIPMTKASRLGVCTALEAMKHSIETSHALDPPDSR